MAQRINIHSIYAPSDDVVVRKIEGELIIVPLAAGIGDMEDELFALNKTGQAVWDKLDGKTHLKKVIAELSAEFEASGAEIEKDVIGLLKELLKRRMVVEV